MAQVSELLSPLFPQGGRDDHQRAAAGIECALEQPQRDVRLSEPDSVGDDHAAVAVEDVAGPLVGPFLVHGERGRTATTISGPPPARHTCEVGGQDSPIKLARRQTLRLRMADAVLSDVGGTIAVIRLIGSFGRLLAHRGGEGRRRPRGHGERLEALAQTVENERAPVHGDPTVRAESAGEDDRAGRKPTTAQIEKEELGDRPFSDPGPTPARWNLQRRVRRGDETHAERA